MASTKPFEDLLASLQGEDDAGDANEAFASLLQATAGTSIANRLNPAAIEIPEPDNYDALISGAYSQTMGGAIPFSDLQNYRNYFQGAGIRSPQDITALITQDIMAKPGMSSRLMQTPERKKMEAYYGLENIAYSTPKSSGKQSLSDISKRFGQTEKFGHKDYQAARQQGYSNEEILNWLNQDQNRLDKENRPGGISGLYDEIARGSVDESKAVNIDRGISSMAQPTAQYTGFYGRGLDFIKNRPNKPAFT